MINLKKRNKEISNLLKNPNFSTKIYVYMSTKVADSDFDPYEKNYTYTNLNPRVIRGYCRDLTGEQSFYKAYGIQVSGIKEILCEDKYETMLKNCNKIEIDGEAYQVFKDSGGRISITKRPHRLIRVTIKRD